MMPGPWDMRDRQEKLDRLLSELEAEHERETDGEMRQAVGQLVDAVEVYLLAQEEQRRRGRA